MITSPCHPALNNFKFSANAAHTILNAVVFEWYLCVNRPRKREWRGHFSCAAFYDIFWLITNLVFTCYTHSKSLKWVKCAIEFGKKLWSTN